MARLTAIVALVATLIVLFSITTSANDDTAWPCDPDTSDNCFEIVVEGGWRGGHYISGGRMVVEVTRLGSKIPEMHVNCTRTYYAISEIAKLLNCTITTYWVGPFHFAFENQVKQYNAHHPATSSRNGCDPQDWQAGTGTEIELPIVGGKHCVPWGNSEHQATAQPGDVRAPGIPIFFMVNGIGVVTGSTKDQGTIRWSWGGSVGALLPTWMGWVDLCYSSSSCSTALSGVTKLHTVQQ